MAGIDLRRVRREYAAAPLTEDAVPDDPMVLLAAWYAAASDGDVVEPNAMVLATVAADGRPTSRTVLLKGLDLADGDAGLVFFTNHESAKGHELAADPRCSVLFPWHPIQRQVRVEGVAEPVDRAESEAYFATRPRDAQLGAWASPQSQVVGGRDELDALLAEATARFDGVDVPCPPHWGGYRISPAVVEFWQGRRGRMHDRLRYRRTDADGWARERLAP